MDNQNTIRKLMITIECMRMVCEHAEGKRKKDNIMLSSAMFLGACTNDKYKYLIDDYQKDSFWKEVKRTISYGLKNYKSWLNTGICNAEAN